MSVTPGHSRRILSEPAFRHRHSLPVHQFRRDPPWIEALQISAIRPSRNTLKPRTRVDPCAAGIKAALRPIVGYPH